MDLLFKKSKSIQSSMCTLYQFGCGISNMVVSKKKDFKPRIKFCRWMTIHQKLAVSLENKVVQKLKKKKLFLQFLTSEIDFGSTILTLWQIVIPQQILFSFFLWVDSWPKILHLGSTIFEVPQQNWYFREHHFKSNLSKWKIGTALSFNKESPIYHDKQEQTYFHSIFAVHSW